MHSPITASLIARIATGEQRGSNTVRRPRRRTRTGGVRRSNIG